MTQLIVHVGFHKTATSFLQQVLMVPEYGYRPLTDHSDVFAHIVQPHGFDFDPQGMRDLLAIGMQGLQPDEVPVMSSEILSGHPFLGGHGSDVYAERIKAIAPQAKILITIRNQMTILPSVYMQYLKRGGTMPYDLFFAGTNEPGYFGFTPQHFAYDRLVGLYQSLFGTDQVIVVQQENLKADLDGTVAKLASDVGNTLFQGLKPAAQTISFANYPEYAAAVLRRINHVQASTLNPTPIVKLGTTPGGLDRWAGAVLRRPPFKGWLSEKTPVSDYVRRTFAGYYTASNVRLAEMIGQPLAYT
jgi:hypothetical protein